jgi:hypothetical protein
MNMNLKMIVPLVIACFLLAGPFKGLRAQSATVTSITSSIKKGDAHDLASYFIANVNVKINSTEGIYSKVQAEQLFDDFFKKNKAIWFEIKGKGALSDDSEYIIATYATDKETYRVYLMVKGAAKGQIYQISFKKER